MILDWLNSPILLYGNYPILYTGPVILMVLGIFVAGIGVGMILGGWHD